jgi:hypothetical protein
MARQFKPNFRNFCMNYNQIYIEDFTSYMGFKQDAYSQKDYRMTTAEIVFSLNALLAQRRLF